MSDRDLALAARIRLAQAEARLTQAELAGMAEMTADKLSKVYAGKRRISSLELALISQATGWTVEKLLGIEIQVTGWRDGYAQACEDAAREADKGYFYSESCDDIAARIRALATIHTIRGTTGETK